jgi:uncharacterized protein YcbK (DUF882 family)
MGERAAARRRMGRPLHRGRVAWHSTLAIVIFAALAFFGFYQPAPALLRSQSAPAAVHTSFGAVGPTALLPPPAVPSLIAHGRSGAVQVRFALPGDGVEYPLAVLGDPTGLTYRWVRLADSSAVGARHDLAGDTLTAPDEPGFYHLALARGDEWRVVDGLTLAVLVPFEAKRGTTLDGYRIGIFPGERSASGGLERPAGFVRVTEADVNVAVTKHLRVGDFLTRDNQTTWPRFVAIDPRLLDKLELVVAQVAKQRKGRGPVDVLLSVTSGFRTPYYNRFNRFAPHSRHQYGDAADLSIDANGDGRFTRRDARLVAKAVDRVEAAHPDLIGGLGVYTRRKWRQPFVHIDARGWRVRWRG